MGEGGVLSGVVPTQFNPADPISLFIIQVVIIITFTRLLNIVLSPLRQTRVISEVIGGIILGPSVFGKIPGYMDTIFPEESRQILNLVATLGLVFFIFLIGVELNFEMSSRIITKNARIAISISAGGIIMCFALGTAVSYGLYTQFTDKTAKFSSFLTFICVAISITGFSVLARIISELKLIHSPAGNAALTASANDDVFLWILLALVISLINSSNNLAALYIFLLCIGWIFIVVIIVRPILMKLIVKTGSNDNGPTLTMMVIILSTILISALVSRIIGIHAIFGGFIIGIIIPREGGFAVGVTEKIEDLINVLFLPIYFAFSGLKTDLNLLNSAKVWLWVLIVIFCAMFGKIVGAGLMARLNKYNWRESLTIGVFMSCKGLVEMIVLNIGYEEKIINARVFVIMRMMSIVTTFATSPLVSWIHGDYQRINRVERQNGREILSIHSKFLVVLNKIEQLPSMMILIRLLQPLPKPDSGGQLPLLGSTEKRIRKNTNVSPPAVHLLRLVELTQRRISAVMKLDEIMSRDPIMNVVRIGQLNNLNIQAKSSVVPAQDFTEQVAESVKDTGSEMVIIPWDGAGVIINDATNNRIKENTSPQVVNFVQGIFDEVSENVGILIDRGIEIGSAANSNGIDIHVYLPFFGGIDNRAALSFVVRLLHWPNVKATVIRIKKPNEPVNNDISLQRIDSKYDSNKDNKIKVSANSNSAVELNLSEEADEVLLSEYFKVNTGKLANDPRVSYREVSSETSLKTAVEYGKQIVTRKDLVVVGRDVITNRREEFIDILNNFGLNNGNDIRKCLGSTAEAFLTDQIVSSVFVVRGKKL